MSKKQNTVKRKLLNTFPPLTDDNSKKKKVATEKEIFSEEPSSGKTNNILVESGAKQQYVVKKTSLRCRGNNNNAIPCTKQAKKGISKVDRSRLEAATHSDQSKIISKGKLVPIIQTRSMKAKQFAPELNQDKGKETTKGSKSRKYRKTKLSNREYEDLNKIDLLTSKEIVDGELVVNEDLGDGVDLSIDGSDLEENFPDTDEGDADRNHDEEVLTTPATQFESGQIQSSSDEDEEAEHQHQNGTVKSKVVLVSKPSTSNSQDNKFTKFSHLKNDPDFREFLKEMIDDNAKTQQSEANKDKTIVR